MDDLILTRNYDALFQEFKRSMMKEFEMMDLEFMHYFLGIEVVLSSQGIFMSQKKYAVEILERFHMTNCSTKNTPIHMTNCSTKNTLIKLAFMLHKDYCKKEVYNTLYK